MSFLLQENGSYLLQENGDKIIIDVVVTPNTQIIDFDNMTALNSEDFGAMTAMASENFGNMIGLSSLDLEDFTIQVD